LNVCQRVSGACDVSTQHARHLVVRKCNPFSVAEQNGELVDVVSLRYVMLFLIQKLLNNSYRLSLYIMNV